MLNGDTDFEPGTADVQETKKDEAKDLKLILRNMLELRKRRRELGISVSNPDYAGKTSRGPPFKRKISFGSEFQALPRKTKPNIINIKPLSIKLYRCDEVKSRTENKIKENMEPIEQENKSEKESVAVSEKPAYVGKVHMCDLCGKIVPETYLANHCILHKKSLLAIDYLQFRTFLEDLCWDPCKENYLCPFSKCWIVFRDSSFLRLHVLSHTNACDYLRNNAFGPEVKTYIVETYKSEIASEFVQDNLRYRCSQCHQWFSTLTGFRKHVELVHSCNKGLHYCSWCGLRFRDETIFNEHRRKRILKHKCVPCKKEFATVCLYVCHQGHTHGTQVSEERMSIVIDEINKSNYSQNNQVEAVPEKEKNPHFGSFDIRCELCNQGFTNRCDYFSHKKIHSKLNKSTNNKTKMTIQNLPVTKAKKEKIPVLNSTSNTAETFAKIPNQELVEKSKEGPEMQTQEVDISNQSIFKVNNMTYDDFVEAYNINKQEIDISNSSNLKVDKVTYQQFKQVCKNATESNRAHICNVCHIEFRSKSYLNAHVKMHKNSNPVTKSNIAGTQTVPIDVDNKVKEVNKVEGLEHARLCETYPVKAEKEEMLHKCDYCGIEYVSKMALDAHLYTHGISGYKQKNMVRNSEERNNSVPQETPRQPDNVIDLSDSIEDAQESSDSERQLYSCEICFCHLKSRSEYVEHYSETHGLALPSCETRGLPESDSDTHALTLPDSDPCGLLEPDCDEPIPIEAPATQTIPVMNKKESPVKIQKKIGPKRYKKKRCKVIKLLIRLRKHHISVQPKLNLISKYTHLKCLVCQIDFSNKVRFRNHMERSHRLFKTAQKMKFDKYSYNRMINRYVKNKYQLCKLVEMIQEPFPKRIKPKGARKKKSYPKRKLNKGAQNYKKASNVISKDFSKITRSKHKKSVKYYGRVSAKDLVILLERCDFIRYC